MGIKSHPRKFSVYEIIYETTKSEHSTFYKVDMGTTQKDHSFKTNSDDRESWKQNFISVYEN